MSIDISPDEAEQTSQREALLMRLAFVFLCLASIAVGLSPLVRAADWSLAGSSWGHLVIIPVWGASAWLMHQVARREAPYRDPYLLPVGMLLTGWGLLIVWRLLPPFGARQTGWLLVATVGLIEVLRGPSDLLWLRRFRYIWLTAGLLLLSLTLLLGSNPSGGEPRLWLGCCGFYFQPSEPLRLLLIAFFASFLADRMALGWSRRAPRLGAALAPLLIVWGISVALLLVQRDLGTGMLFLALLAILLYLASARWQVLLVAAAFALVGGVLGYSFIDVVRQRVDSWLNPWIDPIDSSYQLVQSLTAIASGGVLGRGPGLGMPGVVPVAHTDFVFAAVAEEWGLVGGLGMIALFAMLVARGLKTASLNQDPFKVFLAAGLSIAFGLQALLIIGGVIRLLPLTGVTLPLVSYGGSSLVTSFLALGLLMHASDGRSPTVRFKRPISQIHSAFLLSWVVLALAIGWWMVYRGPALVARTDNPRRGIEARFARRGQILDRGGQVLANTMGERGAYERHFPALAAASVVGYDSLRYGQAGVERSMDDVLRGIAGDDAWTIWGNYLLRGFPPDGHDVRLTLDLALQQTAVEALRGRKGAIVVLDALEGDILALASEPAFDPNRLDEEWESLMARSDAPLLNRGTQGRYQPGGAMAPFILAWAQRTGVAGPDDLAPGMDKAQSVGNNVLTCSQLPISTASRTLGQAARWGCPVPFAELAVQMGSDRLQNMLVAFGFSQPPELRLEVLGTDVVDSPTSADELRRLAVGQGVLAVSPLQMARAFSALANGGLLPGLRIIDAVRLPNGGWARLDSLGDTLRILQSDVASVLLQSIRSPEGHAAEVVAQAISGPESEELAWYLAASIEARPSQVVVVVMEEAGSDQVVVVGQTLLAAAVSAP